MELGGHNASLKLSVNMDLKKILDYVDKEQNNFVDHLRRWVSIKSVSAYPEYRKYCAQMITVAFEELKHLGCDVKIEKNPKGHQHLADGTELSLPPVLLASYEVDKSYKTLCIYGHLDVQPAEKADGWASEPFDLHIDGDKMIGRGSSDDKGPVLGWLCVLKAFKDLEMRPKINLKFIFECMEESGSTGLEQLLINERHGFLKNIDFICISDNYWLGTTKPCVTYGLRGLAYFFLEVSGPEFDIHSGVYGGTIHEPMTDLIYLLSQLVDNKGKILIPGIYKEVADLTDEEKALYEKIEFDIGNYAESLKCNVKNLIHQTKVDLLTHRWRYPTLSLHGIQGAFSHSGSKTVIPAKVIGKFSIRLVPDMNIENVRACVDNYIKDLTIKLNTPNKVNLILESSGPPWIADIKSSNYVAACNATQKIYNVFPDLTREGGSIPVALYFQNLTGKSVVLLPMGRGDDGAHSQNEKLNKSNFINGIKLFATYLDELSKSE